MDGKLYKKMVSGYKAVRDCGAEDCKIVNIVNIVNIVVLYARRSVALAGASVAAGHYSWSGSRSSTFRIVGNRLATAMITR